MSETDELNRHLALAYQSGDIDYYDAMLEISETYSSLSEAYEALRNKPDRSEAETAFVEGYQEYEEML